MTDPTPHDFASMIEDLRNAGISHYKLGVMLGRQTVQVQRWASGSQPKHYEGECIIAIHATICTQLQTELLAQHKQEQEAENMV